LTALAAAATLALEVSLFPPIFGDSKKRQEPQRRLKQQIYRIIKILPIGYLTQTKHASY